MRAFFRRYISILVTALMVAVMLVALPSTALGAGPTDPNTCYLDSDLLQTPLSFDTALATAIPGDTIVLLDNLDVGALLFNTDDLTIDLNGRTLACNTSTGNALHISGVILTIDDSAGAGVLAVTSTDNAGVWVDGSGELALIGGTINVTGNQLGVYTETAGKATVSSVNCTGTSVPTTAARAFGAGSSITVTGDIVASGTFGVNAAGGVVTVGGSVTMTGNTGAGVAVGGAGGRASIAGDVNLEGIYGLGVIASGTAPNDICYAYIGGNIQGIQSSNARAQVNQNAEIIIDGILAPNVGGYITIASVDYTIDDDVTDDPAYAALVAARPGYRLYCDVVNEGYIWVRDILTLTGPSGMTIVEGYTATSSAVFTLNERLSPVVSLSDNLGGKVVWNNTTKKLDIAAGLAPGTYVITITATGSQQTVTKDFTLVVNSLPILIPETGDNMMVLTSALAFASLGIASMAYSKKRRETSSI